MAYIHFEDGQFLGLGTWDERLIFKKAGFRWSPLRKAWITQRQDVAEAIKGVPWTEDAVSHVTKRKEVLLASYELSFAASTEYRPPVPPGLHPRTGKPFEYFPYQCAGIEYALQRKDSLIADQPGLGKQSHVDTPVYTPTGWRRIGDLKVGDEVYSMDGTPTKVIGVYPQGIKPNYEIEFRDGTTTNCGPDHLWLAADVDNRVRRLKNGGAEYSVVTLRHMLDKGIGRPAEDGRKHARWYIPLCEPVRHPEATLPIDPYILGVLIGDGSLTGRALRFSATACSADVVHEVSKRLPKGMWLRKYKHPSDPKFCPYYTIVGPDAAVWMQHIHTLGLNVTSGSKFIPESYKRGSAQQRLDLLRGLMDTDGSCSRNRTTFHTTSSYLATDVRELVQSLGGMAVRRWYTRPGRKPSEAQVSVKLPVCPFYMKRKVAQWKPYLEKRRYIARVERVEDAEQVCIKVAHSSGLYLAEHFIVTHNTPMGIGTFNGDPGARRVLVICPASLKEHWRREFELWKTKDVTVGIAETKKEIKEQIGVWKSGKKKGQPRYKTVQVIDLYWPDTDVVIINYDVLGRFAEQINAQEWDLLICDEAHALKTEDSGRTLFIFGGRKRDRKAGKWVTTWYNAIEAHRRVFLTGTPMMNRPIELWPMAKSFDPESLGKDKKDFGYRYCDGFFDMTLRGAGGAPGDYNYSGSSNLEELGEMLRSRFMIRRLRKEVLPELPPKHRQVIILDSPEIAEVVAREDELAQMLRLYEQTLRNASETEVERILREAAEGALIAERADIMGLRDASEPDKRKIDARFLNMPYAQAISGLEPPAVSIAFEEMASVRRELGMAKLSAGVPWIKNFVEGGEKLLVFGYHTDVLKALQEALGKYDPILIYGGVHPNKRQGLVDHFQEDERCRIGVLQIDAAGTGYTLTRAKDVAFFEGDWVPPKMEQAFDRVCRIGQTAEKLMGFHLVANGSLDCKMAQRAYEKEENITAVMDTRRPT